MNDDNKDPIAEIFGISDTPTFLDIHPNATGNLNERASALVDPTTGELVHRKVDELTQADIEKEERLEDLHIDQQLETVHNAAMAAYEAQQRMSQEVDPKFSARNAEVAAQYLKIALDSTSTRIDAKFKRQKVKIAKDSIGTPNTVNNNMIIADRNELLRTLLSNKEKTIDGE